jgi:hypothetical protein
MTVVSKSTAKQSSGKFMIPMGRLHENVDVDGILTRNVMVKGKYIVRQDMLGDDEIGQLPHVIDFAGQMVVMPGTAKRLWCVFEYGHSISSNGQLRYAYDKELVSKYSTGETKAASVDGSAETVRAHVKNDLACLQQPGTKILDEAGCQNKSDRLILYGMVDNNFEGGRLVFTKHVKNFFSRIPVEGFQHIQMSSAHAKACCLERFYFDTGGPSPNWKNNRGWLTKAPLEMWEGIETDDDGNVTSIRLPNNSLSGGVPASWSRG